MSDLISFFTSNFRTDGYVSSASQSFQGQLSSSYSNALHEALTDAAVADLVGFLYYNETADLATALAIVDAVIAGRFTIDDLFAAAQSKTGPVNGGAITNPTPTITLTGGTLAGIEIDLTPMMGGLDTEYWTTGAGKTGTTYHTREFFTSIGEPAGYDPDWNDVNDAPDAGEDISVSFPEDTPDTAVIASIAATDPEATALTYAITGGNGAGLFEIDASGNISLASGKSLDFETAQQHVLTVTVTDAGGLSDTVQVTIGVMNLDEVDPVITSGAVGTSVDENALAGAVVYTSTATDNPDAGHPSDGPSAVTFSLSGADAALFAIDASGVVTLLGSPDYEAKPSYSFDVVATDAAGNTDTQAVTVAVNNLDEVDPVITSGAVGTSVDENALAGAVVYTSTATDNPDAGHPSDGPSAVTFSLSGADAALFAIDASGVVTLLGSPDYEAKPSYSFDVVATDAAGNTDTQAVTVAVNNLDEVDPVITSGAVGTSVDENALAGAVVYTSTATDNPDAGHPSDGPSAVTFSLSGADAALFAIDASGVVTLLGSPDYEAKPSYSFDVVATDAAGNTDTQAVTVAVNNLDEVDPVITSGAVGTSVDENALAGAVVYTSTATDNPDAGHPSDGPSAVTFSLSGADAALFAIDASGVVTLLGSPDYEAKPSYSFDVVATDAAGNTDTQAVTVAVNNLDEVDPVITSGAVGTSVDENALAGAVVYTSTATDNPDAGHPSDGPSAVTFSLSGADAALFAIDASGVVTLLGSPDYEAKPSYSFDVVATDAAGNTDTQAVTVAVNNLDEVDPVITSGAVGTSVDENALAGAVVYTSTATDNPDAGHPSDGPSAVTFSLSGADAALFAIDASGVVTLLGSPDYEAKPSYSFDVVATDAAGNTDTQAVTVAVNNLDEVDPVITSGAVGTSVDENALAGAVVYTSTATDNPDAGHPSDGPSAVTFSLSGADAALFAIDASGVVTLLGSPDYEAKPSYSFDVVATDAAGNTDTQAVTVAVNNLDEVDPVITSGAVGTSVDENALAGAVVYTSTATDNPDAGHPSDGPSAVTFSLSGADAALFAIDASGVVTLLGSPDYEAKPSYSFDVVATDAAGNTDTQAVTVAVNNLDEVDPVITSGAVGTSVDENALAGAVVYTSTATDNPDAGHPSDGPSAVTFSLSGADAALFAIDASGVVTLLGSPDYEAKPSYSFDVVATDAAGNTDTQAVTVAVNNLDEVDPVITSGAVGTSVDENALAGAVVYTSTATDNPDAGHPSDGPSAVTFSLSGADAALFAIDASGVVTLLGSPDYEAKPSYSFDVVATDAAGNTDTQAVTVAVNNLDEVDPVITSGAVGTSVDENALAGAVVYTSTATDNPDAGHPSDGPSAVTFSLSGADAALFAIDASGVVTLLGSPDYEAKPSYSFDVVATDAAGNTDTQAVTVAVNNLDEVDPVITSGAVGTSVDENALAGAVVYTSTATDNPDAGHPSDGPSAVTFSLSGADAALFAIDASGVVTLLGSPDYEAKPSYSFDVVATDAAGNTDTQAVTVAVNNLDEVDPVITSGAVGTSVDENALAGAVVYTSTATDNPDAGHPSDGPSAVTFSLSGADAALFAIDASGVVTLLGSPDYEAKPSYSFDVVATDAAGNTDTQAVTVAVNNLDEVDPVITSGAVGTSVDENALAGAVVYTSTATDNPDAGHPSDGPSAVTFSLSGADAALFAIDASGVVTLLGSPDYEAKPSYSFDVVATDAAGNTDTQAVTVAVNNLDEVDPVITSGAVGTSVDENALAGAVVYTSTATDNPDAGHPSDGPSAVTFSLSGADAALFAIDASGVVTLLGSPDYEAKPSYSFDVVATDAAGNTDTQAVTVAVNNLDEVDPVITSGAVGTSVDENALAGAVVYTSTATDNPDAGHPSDGPSAVTFSLSGADAALFAIDASGVVTLLGSPDYEAKPSYSFDVVATDAAGNTDTQAVTVAVNNLDEVDPVITSGAVGTSVDENALAGAVVYTSTATDNPDAGHPSDGPSAVTFSLSGADAALFAIDASGVVTLLGSPDYEAKPSYSFDVVATDAAGNTDTQAVTVAVNNLDEVDPVITSGAVGTSVDENALAGAVVYTSTATDNPDAGHPSDGPSAVTFSLSGADAALFAIDASGVVTLLGSPDYEAKPSYSFDVVATDAAGNTDTQAVTVAVNNLDEVDPVITSGAVGTSVDENALAGAVVYTSTATDNPDAGHPSDGPSAVTFSLSGADAALFAIDASGVVTLLGSPDYEAKPSYSFDVVATDAAGNTDTQAVTVAVNNLDEVDPVITSGAVGTSVDENALAGAVVYTSTATDNPDAGHPSDGPSAVTFSLSGADAALFAIDASGVVTLLGSPDYEAKPSYSFDVVATDAAGNTDTQAVTVAVNNLDEVDPVITSGAVGTSVDENALAGAVVYTSTATDNPDAGHPSDGPSAVTFSLSGADAALFAIDASGVVTLLGSPDYEAKPSYSFDVVATDAAGNTDTQAVTVAVNNLDEVDPVITSGAVGTSVDENALAGAVVYTSTATDNPDAGHPSDGPSAVTFSLSGADAALFAIDASGVVTLLGSPDYEAKPSYSFDVVATDAAGNTDTQAVTVAVNNLDEVDPVITSGAVGTSVDENALAGAVVYTSTATDNPDAGHPSDGPSAVTFSLSGADAALFAIDASGVVTLLGSPDYEAKPSYSFDVVATDAAGNTDTQAVTVAVNNLDEVDPVITSGAVGTSVDENALAGAVVYTSTATDNPDAGHPSDGPSAVTFSLSGADAALFAIDASGVVTLLGSPDYEAKPSYSFDVVATDAAGNTDTQAVTVAVNNLVEPPSAANDIASATEASGLNNAIAGVNPSGNVLDNDSDPDDPHSSLFVSAVRTGSEAGTGTAGTVGVALVGAYGSLTLAADGSYTYTVNQSNAAVQALNVGGTLTDTFTYTVQDPGGGTDKAELTVTVHGADDSPSGFNFLLASSGASADNGSSLNAGALIGTFQAIGDPDGGGGAITFDPLSGPGASQFSITSDGTFSVGASNVSAGTYITTITAHQGTHTFQATVKVWIDGVGPGTLTLVGTGDDIDLMYGLNGNDTLTGGNGSDGLIGGPNNDIITGGAGDDQLVGGANTDTFRFSAPSGNGTDTVFDLLQTGGDRIALLQGGDGWNAAGSIATAAGANLALADYIEARAGIVNIAAADTNKVVELQSTQTTAQITTDVGAAANAYVLVFNSTTNQGELWFDSNWSDTSGRTQVASFTDIDTSLELTGLSAAKIAEWTP